MAFFIRKAFSRELNEFLYGYDLDRHTYMGSRYVVTVGLNLDGLMPSEMIEKLYAFKGHIYKCRDMKSVMKMVG